MGSDPGIFQMEYIGKEFVRHEFRFTPAKGKVVNIYRETYKCPECAISEEHPDDQTFVKAPVQEPLIPESYASESVVGWAMHQKYQFMGSDPGTSLVAMISNVVLFIVSFTFF